MFIKNIIASIFVAALSFSCSHQHGAHHSCKHHKANTCEPEQKRVCKITDGVKDCNEGCNKVESFEVDKPFHGPIKH